MPKKVSKSVLQKVNQKVKQTVNINIPTPIPRRRRVTKPRVISPPLNTGTMLSSTIVPAGYTAQSGNAFRDFIPQNQHHRLGRIERTIDDLYSNVSDIRMVKPDPKPITRPIDQPQAFDSGFINRTETPDSFVENSIRKVPINMEDIPIPQQGMATGGGGGGFPFPSSRPIMSTNELELLVQQAKQTDNQEPTPRTLELRRRIDEAMADKYNNASMGDRYRNTLRQQRDIQRDIPTMSMADFLSSSNDSGSDIQFK